MTYWRSRTYQYIFQNGRYINCLKNYNELQDTYAEWVKTNRAELATERRRCALKRTIVTPDETVQSTTPFHFVLQGCIR